MAACTKSVPPVDPMLLETAPDLFVVGSVSDAETFFPLNGIMLVVEAGRQAGKSGFTPSFADTTYMDSKGIFEMKVPYQSSLRYRLRAVDADGLNNGGEYESKEADVKIEPESTSYNGYANVYFVESKLYLSKKK